MTQTMTARVPIVASAIALNVVIAMVVQALKLPIYLDAIGTIIATLMLGLMPGILVGVISFLIATAIISPVYVYFIGTQICIALYIYAVAKYLRGFSSWPRIVATGAGLGVVAGVVSAPVIVWVFGGASGSGRDLVTAVLVGTGQRILSAVFLSGAASEPIDKTLQCVLAALILRGMPVSILRTFRNDILVGNLPALRDDK
jgi:energy-coupling factor transport system substrate-specific component